MKQTIFYPFIKHLHTEKAIVKNKPWSKIAQKTQIKRILDHSFQTTPFLSFPYHGSGIKNSILDQTSFQTTPFLSINVNIFGNKQKKRECVCMGLVFCTTRDAVRTSCLKSVCFFLSFTGYVFMCARYGIFHHMSSNQ